MTTNHLMDEWRDRLLLESRDREVPGGTIGDVLPEVDAHCSATGETPQESFGDPSSYAAAVATAVGARRTPIAVIATKAFLSVAAVHGVLEGASALPQGVQASVTRGQVVTFALAAAGAVVILRALVNARRPSLGVRVALVVAVTAALPVPPLLWPQPVATLPAGLLLVGGVVGLVATWWRANDPIVDPRTGREPFRRPLALEVLSWTPVVLLAVAVVVAVLLPA